MSELIVNQIVQFGPINLKDRGELGRNDLDDLTVVNDTVQRVSHLMGDGRVDKRQQLTFGLGRVVENLLRDIDEADHGFLDLTLFRVLSATFKLALVYLEEFKRRNKLLIDVLHARQISKN